MSVHRDREKWRVKFRIDDGRQKSRTFTSKRDADLFDVEAKRSRQLDRAFRAIEVTVPTTAPRRKRSKATHVYVAASEHGVKIGRAVDPRKRVGDLQVASHVQLTLVRTIAYAHADALEEALHVRYAKYHLRGEWFMARPVLADLASLTDDDLVALARARPAVPPERHETPPGTQKSLQIGG